MPRIKLKKSSLVPSQPASPANTCSLKTNLVAVAEGRKAVFVNVLIRAVTTEGKGKAEQEVEDGTK